LAHNAHNKQRKSGGFFLIIFGAILLFLAPNIHGDYPELGTASFVGGLILGGIGFYIQFIAKKRSRVS